eukprot:UN23239
MFITEESCLQCDLDDCRWSGSGVNGVCWNCPAGENVCSKFSNTDMCDRCLSVGYMECSWIESSCVDCPEYKCYDMKSQSSCEDTCGTTKCYWHDDLTGCLHEGEYIANMSVKLEPKPGINTRTETTEAQHRNTVSNLTSEEFTTPCGFENVITSYTSVIDESTTVETQGGSMSYSDFKENIETQAKEQNTSSSNETSVGFDISAQFLQKTTVECKMCGVESETTVGLDVERSLDTN